MTRRRLLGMGLVTAAAGAVARFVGADDKASQAPTKFEVAMSDAEWQQRLTPAQFSVLRKHGTEYPGQQPARQGVRPRGPTTAPAAICRSSRRTTKFDSRTGWPSFWAPLPNAVGTTTDRTLFMARTEVHCRALRRPPRPRVRRRAEADRAALLHERRRPDVPAGPEPMRAIIASLLVLARGRHRGRAGARPRRPSRAAASGAWSRRSTSSTASSRPPPATPAATTRTRPTSRSRRAATGHAEAVEVVLRPREGHLRAAARRVLAQRRSARPPNAPVLRSRAASTAAAIFTHDETQQKAGRGVRSARSSAALQKPVVTEIAAASQFWPAEDYHQDFYKKNPIRYKLYRAGCGRDQRLEAIWGPASKDRAGAR